MALSEQIERLIEANIPHASDLLVSAETYRGLWPENGRPKAYAERFPLPLLVDNTVPLSKLADAAGVTCLESAEDFRDREDVSELHGFLRYVLFFQSGTRNLKRKIKDCLKELGDDEKPLTVREGLFAAIQHPEIFARAGMDLAGSRFGKTKDVAVLERARHKFRLYRRSPTRQHPVLGMASRGIVVFPAI